MIGCFGEYDEEMAVCNICDYKKLCIAKSNKAAIHEPDPVPGDKIVLELVMKDLNDRAQVGKEKYGTYLMTNNGRDALMDAYQEALDFVMYLRQAIEERKNK
jgi:hypothetical protein